MPLPEELRGRAFSRATARSAGLSDAALGRLGARGDLRRVLPAVWADAARADDERLRLEAALCLDPHVVASHQSAARSWGADAGSRAAHVTAPATTPLRSGYGLVVHRDRLDASQRTLRQGLAVTDPYRTVLDVARTERLTAAVVVADALLWKELVEREELCERLARLHAVRGLVAARTALDLARYGAASPGETRLRLALVQRGVPEPKLQHLVVTAGGTLAADLCWPRQRLVAEYDGFEPHLSRAAFERDRRRWSWFRDAGWELRTYTGESVSQRPDEIAAEVRRLLGV